MPPQDAGRLQQAVAANLKARRLKLGLTQAELGRRMGVNQARIAEIEGSTANPRLSTLWRLAKALDTTVSRLTRNTLG